MVARFGGWRRCWRSPRGHKKLPEVFIGQLGPTREGRNRNHHFQRALEEEQVLCDRDGEQVPQSWSAPVTSASPCTHWWKECESSTSWPSGARGLENGSSTRRERERAQTLPAQLHPRRHRRGTVSACSSNGSQPAVTRAGLASAQDTGVPVPLRAPPPPEPRGSGHSRGCPRASPRVSRPPHPGTAPPSSQRPETPDGPVPRGSRCQSPR